MQVFAINESIFQLNVFWPVFVGLLVPLNRARWLVLAALGVFQFSHPQGLLLLTGATVALWMLRADPLHRGRVKIVAAVTALCLLRVLFFPDPEAAQQASVRVAFALFRQGVLGWPLAGWLCVVAAVWTRSDRGAAALLALAATVWFWWAGDPLRWSKALDARRFVIVFAAPFFFGAWRSLRFPTSPEMSRRALAVALIFSGTPILQANGWRGLMSRVIEQVEADPRSVIPAEDFAWVRGGPAEHWGLGPQVIAKLGGRKLVLDAAGREGLLRIPPLIEIGYDAWVPPEPGVIGWFDFREAVRR